MINKVILDTNKRISRKQNFFFNFGMLTKMVNILLITPLYYITIRDVLFIKIIYYLLRDIRATNGSAVS